MLLAIDAGNTNIVFAVYDGDRKQGLWRMATDGRRTGDDYAVWLIALMKMRGLDPSAVHHAILASVVPAATFNLLILCREHFGCDPMIVGAPGVDLGVEVRIDNPAEVGSDRLVNVVSARAVYPPPLIVVDIGTATTFDIVDGDGHYCGGVIAPGPAASLDALHRNAAKLPKVDIVRPDRVIGKGTVGAMKSGIFWGYVGLIEGLLRRIMDEYGSPMTVIATGGVVDNFAAATDMIHHTDPEITLRGLLLIFRRNHTS